MLSLLAALYGLGVGLRNRRYDRNGATASAPIPVVSVGNLTAGGTGKTPLVAWLARDLAARGRRPAIVSRGYGGTAGRGPYVVSGGQGPRCAADRCGDEPLLLSRKLHDAVVIVGRDRLAGSIAASRCGCAVVLLDDGFQHRRLARDLDILLLDATNPFGGGRLLPAGRLREPLGQMRRADLLIVTRSRRVSAPALAAIERTFREHNGAAPILHADHRCSGFVDAAGAPGLPAHRAVAFCGIGNPELFRADLQSLGLELLAFEARRDHHVWSAAELADLRATAVRQEASLLTTEKDLARLAPSALVAGALPILALSIEAELLEPDGVRAALDRALGDRGSR